MSKLLNVELFIDPNCVMFIPTICTINSEDTGKQYICLTWLGMWIDFSLGGKDV